MSPKKFFAYTLMSIGALTSLLSGGCSLFALTALDDQYMTLLAVLVVGGVPFLIGLGLYFIGKSLKPIRDNDA
jgi:membrane protein DedA with SNARE-associated domain